MDTPEQKTIIKKREWRFVARFSIAAITLAILPYLDGYLIAPLGKVFTGMHIINSYDTYWYVSLIEQAREGNILFKYLSFPESQQAIIFHPLFLLMGWFARIFDLPNIIAYHLFRILLGFAFLWTGYVFISYFLKNETKRKIALVLLAFGAGFGWLVAALKKNSQLPSGDLWMKEINGFLTLYESPLDLAGIILILVIFLSFLKLLNRPKRKYAIIAGLGILFLLLTHPYVALTIILVLALYFLYCLFAKKIPLNNFYGKIPIIFLLSLPGVIYNYYAVNFSEALSFWIKSSGTFYEPSLRYLSVYLSGLGLLAIFSSWAGYRVLREKKKKLYFILIWVFVAFFLAFQPWIHFQIKFLEGIPVAVAILAAEGIYSFFEYLKKYLSFKAAKILIIMLIAITSFTNVLIIIRDISYYLTERTPFYIETDYLNAFNWIKNHAQRNEIILTNQDLAYFVPGATGNPTYFGLLPYEDTDYSKKKMAALKWFYESSADGEKKYAFLKKNNISYFLYAPDSATEKNDNIFYGKDYYYDISNFAPQNIPGLKEAYSNKKAVIYKIE
jgi:hypothetical protein